VFPLKFLRHKIVADINDPQAIGSHYRRIYLIPSAGGCVAEDGKRNLSQDADAIVQAMDKLGERLEAGWTLGSIKIDQDRLGRQWLNVLLKRQSSYPRLALITSEMTINRAA
jgi:hypothetical protein